MQGSKTLKQNFFSKKSLCSGLDFGAQKNSPKLTILPKTAENPNIEKLSFSENIAQKVLNFFFGPCLCENSKAQSGMLQKLSHNQ